MSAAKSMRDALYEEPGPKTRRKMLVGTALSLAALAALVAWVVYRFWVTGQLAPKYWELFSWRTTWRYLFAGLEGTFAVALTAAVLSIILGMLLMRARTSHIRPLSVVCAVLTNVLRGIPSLLFIYFFFFAMPNLGIKMPAFWMLCIPVTLAASGVVVVKDTALAYVVSYPDLMQNAQVLRTNYDALVSTFLVVALIYIVINCLINKVAVYVSRRTGVKIIR